MDGLPAQPQLLPQRYDAMCRAIDAAYEVDEVKDIRDQALAWETYSRQAKNTEAERRACEIRLRAERKAGEILREREKARPGPKPELPSTREGNSAPTLRDLGITEKQSHQWQRLAEMPKEEFEAALADPIQKPSTNGILNSVDPVRARVAAVSEDALWVWGRLKDFDRNGLLAADPNSTTLTMTPEMLDDVHRLAPRVAAWLQKIGRPE